MRRLGSVIYLTVFIRSRGEELFIKNLQFLRGFNPCLFNSFNENHYIYLSTDIQLSRTCRYIMKILNAKFLIYKLSFGKITPLPNPIREQNGSFSRPRIYMRDSTLKSLSHPVYINKSEVKLTCNREKLAK